MAAKTSPARPLRLTILNDSSHVLTLLCNCNYDVVVYDVPMPYASSWDLLDVIRAMASLRSQAFVITTRNKQKLEQAVGRTTAIEVAGQSNELRHLLKAVEAAGTAV